MGGRGYGGRGRRRKEVSKHWCLSSTETIRRIRDGEGGYGGGGEGDYILSLHCHYQNDFCIKMDSDESHFNVSVGSDGQNHRTVSTNHNLFEERTENRSGIEPRSFRLAAYALPLGQTGSREDIK